MPVKDMFDPEDEMTKILIDNPEAFPSAELQKKELDILRQVPFATPNYTMTQTNKYLQSSHSAWKTRKNVKEFSSQGKVRKSDTKYWKMREFQTNVIIIFSGIQINCVLLAAKMGQVFRPIWCEAYGLFTLAVSRTRTGVGTWTRMDGLYGFK